MHGGRHKRLNRSKILKHWIPIDLTFVEEKHPVEGSRLLVDLATFSCLVCYVRIARTLNKPAVSARARLSEEWKLYLTVSLISLRKIVSETCPGSPDLVCPSPLLTSLPPFNDIIRSNQAITAALILWRFKARVALMAFIRVCSQQPAAGNTARPPKLCCRSGGHMHISDPKDFLHTPEHNWKCLSSGSGFVCGHVK